ncbi:hypothetical protein [Lysinibacillus sp. NPDC093216]|uniref:hypothetical protein n=1 Tax=Lysinibacillus sp. NPDC093216 TaxID=3390576 RepID=UPI003D084AEE
MDFWSFFDKYFTAIMVPLGTIIGAFLGANISSRTQKNIISKQIKWDKIKARNLQVNETMEIYSKVLEMDGSLHVIEFNSGHQTEIRLGEYTKKIRPLLFEKFHQLHQDVADQVSDMDELIELCNFEEELSDENSERLAHMYIKLINIIKRHLSMYRENFLKQN